jgi:hypothetical protein
LAGAAKARAGAQQVDESGFDAGMNDYRSERDDSDDYAGARRARHELEKPIRANLDLGGSTQFGRASMRREADREVREARFQSTMDIGAA